MARIDACYSVIDNAAGSLDALLELSSSQEAAGLGDAPWPPHYKKQRDEAAARRAVTTLDQVAFIHFGSVYRNFREA